MQGIFGMKGMKGTKGDYGPPGPPVSTSSIFLLKQRWSKTVFFREQK